MANKGVRNTALGAATCRLIEQYQPEGTRLFNDPLVKELVGGSIRGLMQFGGMRQFTLKQTDALTPGIYGAQVCRTRYIDDAVQAALSQGIDQLVILGAGLDTRPYRLPGIARVKVFEVDLPDAQNAKKQKLQQHFGKLPENVTYLPIDFDKQSLETVLGASQTAFDPARPAVFIWEGVTQYITADAVRQTLAFVGKTAPGSMLIFTYVLKSFIERRSNIPGANKTLDRMEDNHAPWIFGLEPGSGVTDFLRPFHLDVLADVGSAEYQEKYLRPLNRALTVAQIERIVQARVVRN